MQTYAFTLVLRTGPSDVKVEKLYGICQDGTVAIRCGTGHIHLHLVARSLEGALVSALADARAAGISVTRVELAPDGVSLPT